MIFSNIKIAYRNIGKHKFFAGINMFGLAMSMSLGLLIVAVIGDLLGYDKFHVNRKNIYRINTKVQNNSGYSDLKATCPFPLAVELQKNYQGYDNITRIQRFFNANAKSNNKELQMEGYFTEMSFLKMFSFPLLKGNIQTVLANPNSIVLAEKSAQKFFGNEDPVGKVISMGKFGDYVVTGVVSDPPVKSHLKFDVLGSLSSLEKLEKSDIVTPTLDKWNGLLTNYVYIQKSEKNSTEQIKNDLQLIAQKSSTSADEYQFSFQLQSLNKIVPGPDLSSQIGPKMSYLPIMILSGVAFLILLSACINYTNLSLAKALSRTKEVGVRKAIGGSRKQLFVQFLTETMLISLLSLIVASFIFQIVRPEFLKVVPRASEMFTLNVTPLLVITFIVFAFFTGLLAGVIPASALSHFNVIKALKNDTAIKALGKINLRKALIVFQFTLSLIFIVGTIVVFRQYQFSTNYDHGFAIKNRLVVPLEGTDYALFKNEFEKNSLVKSVTGSSEMAGSFQSNSTWFTLPGKVDSLAADYTQTDEHFIGRMEIKLLAGEDFASSGRSKEHSIIVNEQMSKSLGTKQNNEAVGKVIMIDDVPKQVIGVVKDFNYVQLEEPIRNFIFFYKPEQVRFAYLELSGKMDDPAKTSLGLSWSKISGNSLFPGKTLSQQIEDTYLFYINFIKIFGFVALLAIAIGCLGLVGMSLYAAQLRLKEIGIRKVLGASVTSIVMLLSKGFIWLMLIASAIALPISYFLFNGVLENGVYHIQIGVIEMGAGLLVLLLVGGISIISQTMKTAISNPVKSLKTE